MSRIAALGELTRVQGFGLAGVLTLAAEDPPAVLAAWAGLAPDVVAVILTPMAADAIGAETVHSERLVVVLPPRTTIAERRSEDQP